MEEPPPLSQGTPTRRRGPHTGPRDSAEASPMLSVTVMMFRDMVESVMLLKEEACGETPREGLRAGAAAAAAQTPAPHPRPLPTRSVWRMRCFRRRRLCFRMSREEVLCSVELLSLGARS